MDYYHIERMLAVTACFQPTPERNLFTAHAFLDIGTAKPIPEYRLPL